GAVELQRSLLRRAAAEDALPAGPAAVPAHPARPRRPALPDPPALPRCVGELPAGDDRARAAEDRARGRPARLRGTGGVAVLPARRTVDAAAARVRPQPPGRGDAGQADAAPGRGGGGRGARRVYILNPRATAGSPGRRTGAPP